MGSFMSHLQTTKDNMLESIAKKPGQIDVGLQKLAASVRSVTPSSEKGLGKINESTGIPDNIWKYGIGILIFLLMFAYLGVAFWYSRAYGQFRSTPDSISQLLTIRRSDLSNTVDTLTQNTSSVCGQLINKSGVYARILNTQTALVNWRPLTVRLTGYLGGIDNARDGVFDMDKGIQLSLAQGARAFVFDIDYLNNAPCQPVLIHRDPQGYMRSLHTGSIKDGCRSLSNRAFQNNYDPVIVIVYIRRLPSGPKQQDLFFKSIAASLDPLSMYHLGSNEQGDFHNCKMEDNLFTSPITSFQKKFIVLTNYNTNSLSSTPNPKDNLDFWTNCRIYQDPSGISSTLGTVTGPVPNGKIAYATAGDYKQLLNIPTANQANYREGNAGASANTFKIALGNIEYSYTHSDLTLLLNTLGIQCVPMDVVRLSAAPEHANTLTILRRTPPTKVSSLADPLNTKDPLSFWAYSGWSMKYLKGQEGFENPSPVPSTPITGYIIPKPIVPKKPSPSTNSNGGLVNIA